MLSYQVFLRIGGWEAPEGEGGVDSSIIKYGYKFRPFIE
jgi:hypothetical protein